jgi:hypothetical protein
MWLPKMMPVEPIVPYWNQTYWIQTQNDVVKPNMPLLTKPVEATELNYGQIKDEAVDLENNP